MGIYIFTWSELKKYLIKCETPRETSHDFGKDVIPMMLNDKKKIFAYPFDGYWKDVGTVESLWQANMDLIYKEEAFNIHDPLWRIYCRYYESMPQYIAKVAELSSTMISEGTIVKGKVIESVISLLIEKGSEIINSVVMKNAYIGKNVKIYNSIIAEEAVIEEGAVIGHKEIKPGKDMITVVGSKEVIKKNKVYKKEVGGK